MTLDVFLQEFVAGDFFCQRRIFALLNSCWSIYVSDLWWVKITKVWLHEKLSNLRMAHFITYASPYVVDQFCFVGLNECEATAIIFFFPLSASCIRMSPQATSLASVVRVKSCEKFGNEMTGGEVSRFFIFSNALSALSVQVNILFVLFNLCIGHIRLENVSDHICSSKRVSRNCLIHTKRPTRLCSNFFDVGGFISLIARTYSGSALNPSLHTIRPSYFTSEARKVHFSELSLSPNVRRAAKSYSRATKYSSNVLAWTRLSSMYEKIFDRDEMVAKASATHREKIFPADVRPKASCVYW